MLSLQSLPSSDNRLGRAQTFRQSLNHCVQLGARAGKSVLGFPRSGARRSLAGFCLSHVALELGQLLRHRVQINRLSKRGDGAFNPRDFVFEFRQRALRALLFLQRPLLFVEPHSEIAEVAFGPNSGFGGDSRLNLSAPKRFCQTRLFRRTMGRRRMIMGTTDRAGRPFGQLFRENDRLRARKPCLGF